MRKLMFIISLMSLPIIAFGQVVAEKNYDLIIFPGKFVYYQDSLLTDKNYKGTINDVTFINNSPKEITIQAIEFKFYKKGEVIDSTYLFGAEIYQLARDSYQKYMSEDTSSRGKMQGVVFSPSRVLDVQEAIQVDSKQLNFKGTPDKVKIRFVASSGAAEVMERSFKLDLDNTLQRDLNITLSKQALNLENYVNN